MWVDEATVDKWRASEEAKQQPGRLQKLLDEGGVRDFQLVAEVGDDNIGFFSPLGVSPPHSWSLPLP
jgi:hypothetical protein